jgi:hypothetical protein
MRPAIVLFLRALVVLGAILAVMSCSHFVESL